MKKYQLYLAIAMFIITTVLILMLMFAFEYSRLSSALITFVSITGYLISYMYYDTYKASQNQ